MTVSSKTNDHAEPNYWMVWLALAVLTAIELLVARVPNAKAFVVFSLCALALTKAALVALYFMHLKFEPRRLVVTIMAPLPLAVILVLAVLREYAK